MGFVQTSKRDIKAKLSAITAMAIGQKGEIDDVIITKTGENEVTIAIPGSNYVIEQITKATMGNILAQISVKPIGGLGWNINMKQNTDGSIVYFCNKEIIPANNVVLQFLKLNEKEILDIIHADFAPAEEVIGSAFEQLKAGTVVAMPEGFVYEIKQADNDSIKSVIEQKAKGVVLSAPQEAMLKRNDKVKAGEAFVVRLTYKTFINKLIEVSSLGYTVL